MAFDYYDRMTTDMGTAAVNAANGTVAQLQTLYPAKTPAQVNAMVGITIMPGLDDYPKKTENTTVAHAQQVLSSARVARHQHTLDLGDPARQRRVSRGDRLQQLLGHRPEHVGLHARAAALHRLTSPGALTHCGG